MFFAIQQFQNQNSSEDFSKKRTHSSAQAQFSRSHSSKNLIGRDKGAAIPGGGRVKPRFSKTDSTAPDYEPPPPPSRSRKLTVGTGGAPRTVVVRTKIPPIEEHEGMNHVREGYALQAEGKLKAAVKVE